jgi:hypothetical protein
MKSLFRRIHATMAQLGVDPLRWISLRYLPAFVRDIKAYRASANLEGAEFPLLWRNLFPILTDKQDKAGDTRSHYFQMDLWMARRVVQAAPSMHMDIGSRLDGFVAHLLAAGLPVTVVDIRPLDDAPAGLSVLQADATKLSSVADASVTSLSSLHAAEHFGLGRYGDPVDAEACFAFMRTLARVLAKGGRLYFAVPVGVQRVEFNAHRVFSPATIERIFVQEAGLKVLEQALITTDCRLKEGPDALQNAPTEAFGCGLYVFSK